MAALNIKILVVDDEPGILDALRINLEIDGYHVFTASNGPDAMLLVKQYKFDLLILDVNLPGCDGYEICTFFRKTDERTPVIFISAIHSSAQRIHGLRLGADDFLSKPFELEEILLKVNRLTNRAERELPEDQFSFGGCVVDFDRMEATGPKGDPIRLSKIEIDLIRYFVSHAERPVTRDELLKNVWGYQVVPTSRTVDNFILYLRKYFETDPSKPRHFLSIRSVGYKFIP